MMNVTIVPDGDGGKYKCTLALTDDFKKLPYPIQGQGTATAFAQAVGQSPEHALSEVYKLIGQAVVYAMRNCDVELVKKEPVEEKK